MKNYNFSRYEDRQAFYKSWEWRAVRQLKLAQKPLCEECLKKDILTPATDVDHIQDLVDAPWLCLIMDNMRSLCKSCHSKKTLSSMYGQETPGKIVNNKWNLNEIKFRR